MAGSGRLERAFASRPSATGLIPYLTAGYPSPEVTLELMHMLEAAGALAIEIGIPFSDPIADGPDLQRASERALGKGMSASGALDLIRRFRERGTLPVIVMTYANPVLRLGIDRFSRSARDAGADAVILSDLPPDESPEVWRALDDAGLDSVLLVAPTTSAERLSSIVSRCRGFVYCLARTGVTGAGEGYAGSIADRVRDIRALTSLPVAIGFGISAPEQARALRGIVEGVVVGAAFARDVAADPDAGVVERIEARARALIDAMA
jgi:tryptophan synthase alpha chain